LERKSKPTIARGVPAGLQAVGTGKRPIEASLGLATTRQLAPCCQCPLPWWEAVAGAGSFGAAADPIEDYLALMEKGPPPGDPHTDIEGT